MKLDLTKPLQIRFSNGVVLPVTDLVILDEVRVHAYWVRPEIGKSCEDFGAQSGISNEGSGRLLQNVPPTRVFEGWLNVYRNPANGKIIETLFNDKIDAESRALYRNPANGKIIETLFNDKIDAESRALSRQEKTVLEMIASCVHIRHEYQEGQGL